MNSQEHYQEAEKILRDLRNPPEHKPVKPGTMSRAELLAVAQVHATLALAAATETVGIRAAGTSTDQYPSPVSRGTQGTHSPYHR